MELKSCITKSDLNLNKKFNYFQPVVAKVSIPNQRSEVIGSLKSDDDEDNGNNKLLILLSNCFHE